MSFFFFCCYYFWFCDFVFLKSPSLNSTACMCTRLVLFIRNLVTYQGPHYWSILAINKSFTTMVPQEVVRLYESLTHACMVNSLDLILYKIFTSKCRYRKVRNLMAVLCTNTLIWSTELKRQNYASSLSSVNDVKTASKN